MTESDLIKLLRKKESAVELYNACLLALEAINTVTLTESNRDLLHAAGNSLIKALAKADGPMHDD